MESAPVVNWIAVLLATVSAFVIGGLWYSPLLFAKPWMALTGVTEEKARAANMGMIYGSTFVLAGIAATNLAFFIGPDAPAATAAGYGLAAGAGWVATAYGTTYLFEQKPLKLWAINAGYHVVTLTVMGLIIGLM
jgi:hypothetical protein